MLAFHVKRWHNSFTAIKQGNANANMNKIEEALQDLKRRMATTDAEWPDVTWQVCQRWGVQYEELADAYDADNNQGEQQ